MPSYIILELDTRPPNIEILAPKYTTKNIINRITIQADENLSDYQDIYIVDSNNVRHEYTFDKDKNKFVGMVNFNVYPVGVATIYAIVKDEVDNISDLISSKIEVKDTIPLLRLKINDYAMNVNSSTNVRRFVDSSSTMEVKIESSDKWEDEVF